MIDPNLIALVHNHLSDRDTGWSVAVFGAIAEFLSGSGLLREAFLKPHGGSVTTQDGAMRIDLTTNVRLIPYEILTKRRDYWLQGVNFCLPDAASQLDCRSVLTEIGQDRLAIRDRDRDGILFDLGLGLPTLQAMVRVSDPNQIDALRQHTGVNLLAPEGHDAFALLVRDSPHRVFRSRLGRVEVYAPIPALDGTTHAGAHTHILPDLLKAGRTHAANVPVPDGWTPCFQMFPPNPILTPQGTKRAQLDKGRFDAFQAMLKTYGQEELVAVRQRVRTALAQEMQPPDPAGFSRAERTVIRVVLRQAVCLTPGNVTLPDWQAVFERDADDEVAISD